LRWVLAGHGDFGWYVRNCNTLFRFVTKLMKLSAAGGASSSHKLAATETVPPTTRSLQARDSGVARAPIPEKSGRSLSTRQRNRHPMRNRRRLGLSCPVGKRETLDRKGATPLGDFYLEAEPVRRFSTSSSSRPSAPVPCAPRAAPCVNKVATTAFKIAPLGTGAGALRRLRFDDRPQEDIEQKHESRRPQPDRPERHRESCSWAISSDSTST